MIEAILILTGTATYYEVGIMETVAENRGMDLSGWVSGIALNDPRHLGDVVWLDWGDEVTGPHLSIDCAQKRHIAERERLGRVVEVSAELAVERGFYGVGPVPVKVLFERPPNSKQRKGCALCGEMVERLIWTKDGRALVCEPCWSEYRQRT